MTAQTDQQLLRDYAGNHSEPAFAELVRRHIDLVHSAALRMVCDSHQAEDVTQGVFVALAQNARQLTHHPVLSGWLHRTTQNLAANAIRANVRRQTREQEAVIMNELLSAEPDASWENIAPVLDAALGELNEPDRDALLLRYFERKSAREMAQILGVSDEAAQKRVSRAVERLREFFAKRGVSVGTSGLVVVISANAVQAAPVGLAATISTAATFTGTTVVTTTTAAVTKALAMTTLQKTLITATIAVLAGAGIYEAHQGSALRNQVENLTQQLAPLAEQIQQSQQERDRATRQIAALRDDNERLNRNTAELLKLRSEVGRLTRDSQALAQSKATDAQKANDPMESAAKALLGRIKLLHLRLDQMPEKSIPELQYLDDEFWARVAQTAKLDTDEGARRSLSSLRDFAKQFFAPMMGKALQAYVRANNGQLPIDVSQLKPYFTTRVDDATLQRYQMTKTGNVGELQPDDMVVAEKAAVDDEYDNLFQIGLNGRRSQGVGKNKGGSSTGGWSADHSAQPQIQGVGK